MKSSTPKSKPIQQVAVSNTTSKFSAVRTLCRFCALFPSYKLQEAREIPYRHIRAMINAAENEHAYKMLDLLSVEVASQTQKGSKKAKEHFRRRIKA